MENPNRIYELLLDYTCSKPGIDHALIGQVWTIIQSSDSTGLAMSPDAFTRTLPWSGSLQGKSLKNIASWITSWNFHEASLAMAAINCCLNTRPLPLSVPLNTLSENPNLAVFDYFLPKIQQKKVVVIGRYPGIERYEQQMDLSILERKPGSNDLPDTACEYLLPDADWVFITASSIPNKTFPRLAELSANAQTVLLGPTVPWLPQMHEFGINYLAGIEVIDAGQLYETIAQGGGVRIFNNGVRFRVADLNPDNSLVWLKKEIADCYNDKTTLSTAMENWYNDGNVVRFPDYLLLEENNRHLSRLDSSFKKLWDEQNRKNNHV
jgi:uncharacterized protein (DUF4213/DUF364 family)